MRLADLSMAYHEWFVIEQPAEVGEEPQTPT